MKVIKFENNADRVLESSKGLYDKVFIVGYDNEEILTVAHDGKLDNQEKLWLLENAKQALLNGEI